MHIFLTQLTVRAQLLKFVQRHLINFNKPVKKYAPLCSAHFEETCFKKLSCVKNGAQAKAGSDSCLSPNKRQHSSVRSKYAML